MHILFLTENFPPEMNAAASRVYERACYWVKWGHKVTVITTAPNFPMGKIFEGYKNKWYQEEEISDIKVIRVKTYISPNSGKIRRILDFLSFMVMGFITSLSQNKPDVVAATSPQFFTAIAGWAVGLVRRVPFVFELGDLWPASITAVGAMEDNVLIKMVEKLELFLYRQSACVAALTNSFKRDLVRRNIPADKIAVVINGVDLSRYERRNKDSELQNELKIKDKFVIGYIGTHGMAHALENVLYAADKLRKHENVCFMFVGPGAARDGLIKIKNERRLSNVLFIPPQPKDNIPRYWALCDIALIHLKDTPVFESVIPSKIFEAMGMGLPLLLATPKGEASAIVEKESAGIIVKPENPKALAEAVIELIKDPDRLNYYASKSHAAAPLYSREKQATDMLRVLQCAAAGEGSIVAKKVHTE